MKLTIRINRPECMSQKYRIHNILSPKIAMCMILDWPPTEAVWRNCEGSRAARARACVPAAAARRAGGARRTGLGASDTVTNATHSPESYYSGEPVVCLRDSLVQCSGRGQGWCCDHSGGGARSRCSAELQSGRDRGFGSYIWRVRRQCNAVFFRSCIA